MFFHLIQNKRFTAHHSDTNKELITTYKVVKDYVENLQVLGKHQEEYKKNPSRYYYRLRAAQPKNNIEKAARFIALNKTCFNGLYRVNRKGEFNVPIGDYKNPVICDKTNRSYSVNDSATYKNTFKHLFPSISLSSDVVNRAPAIF
jgi:DNA adenine methylase